MLTVVGTLKANRKGIPEGMKKTDGREDKSVLYAYCEDLKSLMISYVLKKKSGWKNVLVLSSMHKSVNITNDDRQKPDVIVFYGHTKGGADVMDQKAACFTTLFKSHRWTMNMLSYILDTPRIHLNTLWNEMNPENKLSSFNCLWELGQSLIMSHIHNRYENRVTL